MGKHTDGELDSFASWERRAWEAQASSYATGITGLTKGAAGALLDAAAVTAGVRLLDVATGPGIVALAARSRGAEVAAVDQSDAMVGLARAAGIDARQASVDRLPFDDGAFDAVVAGFLVNHLARPVEGVVELARVSRARVAVSVWDCPDANLALGLVGVVARSFDVVDPTPPGPESSLFSDDARLASLLDDAGLDDVHVTRVRWTHTVDPGTWFDAVAAGTPRTGAILAAASPEQRAEIRARYVELATASHGGPPGLVTLPAGALVGSGR